MSAAPEFVVYVTYTGTPESRFDRAYYDNTHMPLVRQAWSAHGLRSATAFYPDPSHTGVVAIAELRFTDRAAFDHALSLPASEAVMADVPNYTDIKAEFAVAAPL